MAVSTAAAQDTLRIVSYRTIDVCSNDKRWLVAVSLGRINFSDSLQSFDITIGFNPEVLRPTDALKEGTLAGQMSIGPLFNLASPGEIRIAGYNTLRSVGGDFPLIGVAGDFIGTCGEIGRLTLPYPIDFNGEFKRRYLVSQIDSIKAVAIAKTDATKGVRLRQDSVLIADTMVSTTLTADIIGTIPSSGLLVTMSTGIDWDSTAVGQPSVNVVNAHLVEIRRGNRSVSVLVKNDSTTSLQPYIIYGIQRRNPTSEGVLTVSVSSVSEDQCSCLQPKLADTATIEINKSIVSSIDSDDDAVCTMVVQNEHIIGKCHHDQIQSIEIKDVVGRIVAVTTPLDSNGLLSIEDLPHGIFFVSMTCGYGITQKTIVK